MGVYTRYKREIGGFRKLVELLESAPRKRLIKMIEVGMQEDPEYTKKAMKYVMTWDDVLSLSDEELAELLSHAPPRFVAIAASTLPKEVQERFLKLALPQARAEIKEFLGSEFEEIEVAAAQKKLVSVARDLEKKGIIQKKHIPDE